MSKLSFVNLELKSGKQPSFRPSYERMLIIISFRKPRDPF